VTTTRGRSEKPDQRRPAPAAWAWTDPAAAAALRSRQIGTILRAYRRLNGLPQENLGALLGYDASYISMLETGRRAVHDVASRRHLADVLAVPAHLFGVTDAEDTDHVAMVEFAEATLRLADLARVTGHAGDAVKELWIMVSRLEARAAAGHLEPVILTLLVRARISLGVCLGTVLPEEQLDVAVRCTGTAIAAARHLPDDAAAARLRHHAATMHGNELRSAGHPVAAVRRLQDAVRTAPDERDRGAALALLVRAAAEAGARGLVADAVRAADELMDRRAPRSSLADPFVWREIRLRALLDLGDSKGAARLTDRDPRTGAPAPQWAVIADVTDAAAHFAAGDDDHAAELLCTVIDGAARHRLPHQVQRAGRVAEGAGHRELTEHARATVADLSREPVAIS
jgi:transcriptional regulator with XRE-family HTH domain